MSKQNERPRAEAARGRPRDPAVGEAVLREALALLEEHGYAGLRVADVARTAGVGLGAVYRRWPTKYALVVAALRAATGDITGTETGDPETDLVAGLVRIADRLRGRGGALLSVLLSDPDSDLAAAVREAKIEPATRANRDRLRRLVGDAPDLDTRADAGPSLIFLHHLLTGTAPDEAHIRAHILPVMLAAGSGHGAGRGA